MPPLHKTLTSLTWLTSRKARISSRSSGSQPLVLTFTLYGLPIPVLPNTYTLIKYLLTQNCHKMFPTQSSRWTKQASGQETSVLIPLATPIIQFDRLYAEVIAAC